MPDILKLISQADRLDFSQNYGIARPNFLGDTLFPDVKTQSLQAEYLRLASGAALPVIASVHAFDTEAEIASRPALDKVNIEKLFIKRKINQTEKMRLLRNNGVNSDDAIVDYVFDDMGRLADAVKTRTELAKMEVLATGKMTIDENSLNLAIDFGVASENTNHSFNWSAADADILGDMQTVVDMAAEKGQAITGIVISSKVLRQMRNNTRIRTYIFGSAGAGTLVTKAQLQALFGEQFGFTEINVNDLRYGQENAAGAITSKRFFPENKVSFICKAANGSVGTGLWGVTPEEESLGQYTEKSAKQFITLTQWATPDPVAVWTKASGLFIPVLPNPDGLFIATVTI